MAKLDTFLSKFPWAINSPWPSCPIWQRKSGSTLVQVTACCLTAPSHYLTQHWLHISEVVWYSPEINFTECPSCIISLKIILLKLRPYLLEASELMIQYTLPLCRWYYSKLVDQIPWEITAHLILMHIIMLSFSWFAIVSADSDYSQATLLWLLKHWPSVWDQVCLLYQASS